MKAAHLAVRIIAILTVLLILMAVATVVSAAQGEARLSAYFAKDFTDAAYQQKAYQKVAAAWALPAKTPAAGHKTVVIATVARDGTVASTIINMKSGETAWDDSALAAVKKASPLPAFPASYANPTTEVHFHFEWAAAGAKR